MFLILTPKCNKNKRVDFIRDFILKTLLVKDNAIMTMKIVRPKLVIFISYENAVRCDQEELET